MNCQLTNLTNTTDSLNQICEITIENKIVIVHLAIRSYYRNLKSRPYGDPISNAIALKKSTPAKMMAALVAPLSQITTEEQLVDFLANQADAIIINAIDNTTTNATKVNNKVELSQFANKQDLNTFLRKNGYKWHKYGGEESRGGQYTEERWVLEDVNDNYREVTVSQAIDEINRGKEVVKSEVKAKAEQAKAQAELERQQRLVEQEKVDAEQAAEYAKYSAVKVEVTEGLIEVDKSFDYSNFTVVYQSKNNKVFAGEIDGSKAVVIINCFSDGDNYSFYRSGKPEVKSDLKKSMEDVFNDFWG